MTMDGWPPSAPTTAPCGRRRLGTLLAVAGLLACSRPTLRECEALLDERDFASAAERCGERFEKTGDPAAALAAARAQNALGHHQQVLDWQTPLQGKPQELQLLRMVTEIHRRGGQKADLGQAQERLRKLADASRDAGAAADAYHTLAVQAWQASDYGRALDVGRRALESAEKAADPKRKAAALRAIFVAYYEIGDLQAALAVLDEEEKLLGPKDDEARARRLANRAGLRLDEGRLELARDDAERALEQGRGVDDRRFQRTAHLNLAMAHLRLGHADQAAGHVEAAARHVDPAGTPPTSLRYVRARVQIAQQQNRDAVESIDSALRAKPAPEWEWDLLFWKGAALEGMGRPAAAAEAYQRAISVVEQMRADLGVDDLKAWLLDRNREPYESLFRLQARSGDARAALQTFERATARSFLDAFVRTTATASGPPVPAEPAPSLERLAALQDLMPRMSASPVAALRPVDALLRSLADRHVLAYFRAQQELWLLVVSRGRVHLHRLAEPVTVVRDLADTLAQDPSRNDTSARLADVLLPAGTLPAPGTLVYLVADDFLEDVPFAALRTRGRFLVDDHALSQVPSLNALAALAERPADEEGPPVVLADPGGDLAEAAAEAREVAAVLRVDASVGAAATTERLRQAARARVLHLATHTGLSHRGPWIATAEGPVGADVVLGTPIAPRLVVLATCVSAASRGRGMWGSLGVTFLAAGSRSVVATLRSVEDRSARELIGRFYAQGGGEDPAEGLARAMRSFIREGRDPSVWTPFVHIGLGSRVR
jgi:tetratricopeptide (TPR) repeat protein